MQNNSMVRKIMVFGIALFLSCGSALAAEDCSNPQTQTDMNICSGKSYEKADSELNATYQKALKILEQQESADIEKFKNVQRAWLKFRDLNCNYASDGYEGGTIAPLIHANCMTELTEQRTKQIPGFFQEWNSY